MSYFVLFACFLILLFFCNVGLSSYVIVIKLNKGLISARNIGKISKCTYSVVEKCAALRCPVAIAVCTGDATVPIPGTGIGGIGTGVAAAGTSSSSSSLSSTSSQGVFWLQSVLNVRTVLNPTSASSSRSAMLGGSGAAKSSDYVIKIKAQPAWLVPPIRPQSYLNLSTAAMTSGGGGGGGGTGAAAAAAAAVAIAEMQIRGALAAVVEQQCNANSPTAALQELLATPLSTYAAQKQQFEAHITGLQAEVQVQKRCFDLLHAVGLWFKKSSTCIRRVVFIWIFYSAIIYFCSCEC
jgi:hypothetical protein